MSPTPHCWANITSLYISEIQNIILLREKKKHTHTNTETDPETWASWRWGGKLPSFITDSKSQSCSRVTLTQQNKGVMVKFTSKTRFVLSFLGGSTT